MPTEPTDREGLTRAWWLENNRAIMEGEGFNEAEIWYNQIETRLRLEPEIRTEADERLGDAYVACLNEQESRADTDWNPFLQLQISDLVIETGVPELEAAVVYFMAAMEYGPTEITTDSIGRERPQF